MRLLCLDIPLPGTTLEAYQPHLQEETRHAWKLYKSGFVRDIYFRQDRPGAAIMAESDSVDAARRILTELPFSKVGLIDWQVIPLGAFAGWESLFAPGDA